MKLQNVWGYIQREWGYEIRVDFTDDEGIIFNETMVFSSEPSEEELNQKITEVKEQLESREVVNGNENI